MLNKKKNTLNLPKPASSSKKKSITGMTDDVMSNYSKSS